MIILLMIKLINDLIIARIISRKYCILFYLSLLLNILELNQIIISNK